MRIDTDSKLSPPGVSRYESLDCIRGIAACIVMVGHTLPAFYSASLIRFFWLPPVAFIFSGHQAVLLFFVLSGFSLFLMFDSMSGVPHASLKFVAARWIRLYPAYILSVAFAVVVYWVLRHEQFAWPGNLYPTAATFTPHDILQHVLLIGAFDPNLYNPVLWSIVLEMRISILFPLLYLLVLRSPATTLITATAFSLVIAGWTFHTTTAMGFDGVQNVPFSVISTAYHSTFFIFGAVLARFRSGLVRRITSASGAMTIAFLVLCLGMYTYSPAGLSQAQGRTITLGDLILSDLLGGAASCGLILLALAFPVLARIAPLRWLGRISYSVYLMHFTLLESLIVLFAGSVAASLLTGIIFTCALLAATLVWKYVDTPAIELSRVVRKFGRSRGAAVLRHTT